MIRTNDNSSKPKHIILNNSIGLTGTMQESIKPENTMDTTPSLPEKTRGRFPVRVSDSSFETIETKNDIPLQSWSSRAGPGRDTSSLPPLYRPSDPVMDDYMKPIPRENTGELPPRPHIPWYRRRWMYLVAFMIFLSLIIPGSVLLALPGASELSAPTASIPPTTISVIQTEEVAIETSTQTRNFTIPLTSMTTLSQTKPTPVRTLTTVTTKTKLVNTVIPITIEPPEPSTTTTVIYTTETFTVAPTRRAEPRKITLDNHRYTTLTETITDTVFATRTLGKWVTLTRSSIKPSMTQVSKTTQIRQRGFFDWNWHPTITRTETAHKKVTVTKTKLLTNYVYADPRPTARSIPRMASPPIDLRTCQIAYNGVATSNERCHGLCNSGYCYAYWDKIPCDQWSCCQACGCYNNTLTPTMAANAPSRGQRDCRISAPPFADVSGTLNTTKSNELNPTAL